MMVRVIVGLNRKNRWMAAIGLALALSGGATLHAEASPLASASHWRGATVLPLVDAQARYHRSPERRPVRRGRDNNGALVAGALVGAAILGGVIVAQSEAERRERRRRARYYESQPSYYDGQPTYYYGPPRRVYRPAPRDYVDDGRYGYGQPRVYYPQPRRNRSCLVNTPERETPYTYVPC